MAVSRTNTPEARRELGLDSRESRRARAAHAVRVVTAWWRSKEWKSAWALLIVNLSFNLYGVTILVSFADWERRLFDALAARDGAAIPALVARFFWLMVQQTSLPVIGGFFGYYLMMRWRLWLTRSYIDRWLGNGQYLEIERTRLIDNPDQRIADDTRIVAEDFYNLFAATLSSFYSALSWSIVLYGMSVPIRLAAFGVGVTIPGDMVAFAWAVGVSGTVIVAVIARPLVRRTMRQQHFDADLRFGLGNIRRYAEQIAFSGAAPFERRALERTIVNIRRNYQHYIYAMLGLQAGQTLFGRISEVAPLMLSIPRYLAGTMTLGQIEQGRQAFRNLQGSLAIFIQGYQGIATQIATFNRLKALDDSIDHPRPRRIVPVSSDDRSIRVDALDIQLPDGSHLMSVPHWIVRRGERWAMTGASGSGKSTLLRALAGLWPDGHGTIEVPGDGLVMFVPQRLYLPIGQLKDAVTFPASASDFDDAAVLKLFELCRVGHLADRLHVPDVWHDLLSPGEQQRLALVRVLLHRPDHLLLDEATSALDEDNAVHLYRTLVEQLPEATIVSITHSASLSGFHDHRLCIADGFARVMKDAGNETDA